VRIDGAVRSDGAMTGESAPLAIAFDVDETLVSTGGAGARSWARSFATLWGVDADITRYTKGGMTDPEVGRITFVGVMGREPARGELARLMDEYLVVLPEEVATSPGYHVLPGIPALLLRLIESGVLVGITSGAVEPATHIKLARAGLNQYFSFGGFGSDSNDRGELTRIALRRAAVVLGGTLDPARVCVVGDTPMDIAAAHAAGAVGIGVATGKYSADQLNAAGADHVLADLAQPFPGLPV
jgi:phosphoglycolate phosphatase